MPCTPPRMPSLLRATLLCLLALLAGGCQRNPGKPLAELTYQGFERVNLNLYVIKYSADMDLLNVFNRANGEGQIVTLLFCSLDGDPDFSAAHVFNTAFEGMIGIRGKTPGPPYAYTTLGSLIVNSEQRTTQRDLTPEELSVLLRQRDHVVCKAFITVFGYKAYYSKPMHVPTADMLREVQKTPRVWIKGGGEQYLPPELRYTP